MTLGRQDTTSVPLKQSPNFEYFFCDTGKNKAKACAVVREIARRSFGGGMNS
jgi:hypothetical protein